MRFWKPTDPPEDNNHLPKLIRIQTTATVGTASFNVGSDMHVCINHGYMKSIERLYNFNLHVQ